MKKLIILLPLLFLVRCDTAETGNVYIYAFSGNVTVNGTAVKTSKLNIRYGDVIETGTGSYCDIIINSRNIIRIKDNTRLVYRISAKESILQVDRGWLASVIRKKFSSDGIIYIKTPTLTAAVRGTSFCMKVESQVKSYFCVCNGSVTLAGTGEKTTETVTAAEHMGRRFTLDKNSGFISIDRSPGMIYHDSAGLEELAGIISEKIDWTHPDEL